MARGSQGYLIAVILLTLMVMVFGILSYLGFSRASEMASKVDTKSAELSEAQKEAKGAKALVDILMSQSGVDSQNNSVLDTLEGQVSTGGGELSSKLDSAKNAFGNYMGKAVPVDDSVPAPTSYQELVDQLLSFVNGAHSSNASLVEQIKQEKLQKEVEINQIQEKLTKAEEKVASLTQDLDDEKKRNLEKETELQSVVTAHEAKITDLTNTIVERNKDLDQVRTERNATVDKLEADVQKLKRDNERLTSLGSSTVPDGRIAHVRGRYVTINRGSADGLKERQTFSVFDMRETNFDSTAPKGKIEVTRITGPHLAEGWIHDQAIGDPILENDVLLSPTWDPGYSVPVAFIGIIDLDGDGEGDNQRFVDFLKRNQAEVIAWQDELGNRNGDIDSTTRYIIEGEIPTEGAANRAYALYSEQADKYSVQRVSARRFMEILGRRDLQKSSSTVETTRQAFPQRNPNSAFGSGNR